MKILHVDLETAYIVGAVWQMWDTSVAQTLQDPYILGFGYAWNHIDKVHWVGMSDFPSSYKKDHTNDKQIMLVLHKLIEEADVIVAHNAKAFDVKKIKGRFMFHGLSPTSPFKVVDTKLVAKQFGFPSNKLDELSRVLLGERKMKHEGIELWTRCMDKKIDVAAWKMMGDYCKKDVILLKRLYQRMLPWVENHPNWNAYEELEMACTKCGSAQIKKEGFDYGKTTKVQMYSCRKCGGWSRGKSQRVAEIR
jgi:hypothetical protein